MLDGKLSVVFVVTVALACSRTGPSPVESDGTTASFPPPVEMSASEWQAALTSTTALVESFGAQLDENRATLATKLGATAGFTNAGVASDGSVWARMANGHLVMVPVGRMLPLTDEIQPLLAPAARALLAAPSPVQVPKEQTFYAARGDAGLLPTATTVAAMLKDAGYRRAGTETATVDELMQLSKQKFAVFYLDAHAAIGPNDEVFAVSTNELVDPSTPDRHRAELDAGRVVIMPTPGGKALSYGITDGFVRKYLNFATPSLVFLNVCKSADELIRSAFTAQGATAYVGWTDSVLDPGADQVGKFFFDRLLGANLIDPKVDPLRRPFDYASVLDELRSHKLDVLLGKQATRGLRRKKYGSNSTPLQPSQPTDPWTQVRSNLVILNSGADPVGLLPSIEQGWVEESQDELYLRGAFGSDGSTGKVTVGGGDCAVLEWKPAQIRCKLVRSGPGSSGDMVVRLGDRDSNAVPLTEYTGQIRYELKGEGTLRATLTVNARFRIDAHMPRLKSGDQPVLTLPQTSLTQDSSAQWSASGTSRMGDATITWSGSGSLKPLDSAGADPMNSVQTYGSLAQDLKKAVLTLAFATDPMIVRYQPDASGPVELPLYLPIDAQLTKTFTTTDGQTVRGNIAATVAEDWSIQAGQSGPIDLPAMVGYGVRSVEINWDAFTARSPPTPAQDPEAY